MSVIPVYYAPDVDTAWNANPGALATLNSFAPLQLGAYGSMGAATYFSSSLTGRDHLNAYMFRQIDGTVRFLTFRVSDIDEYNSSGTRTNRGTGYNAGTTNWSAAAWGNQIIACNYFAVPQSSTGAGFGNLGGSPPKARYIAANLNFVMLADVDDSGSNVYSDMVWWCALQNPASWSPSIATQAGNVRLLDAPGPIRALVAYRDTFVAFKDNAIFVGEYVGPAAFIFQWRLVSNHVGCIAPNSVVELDGKLYFLHSSGFYEFDGQTLRNVGLQVFHSFCVEVGYATIVSGDTVPPPDAAFTSASITTAQAAADDIEGCVWWSVGYTNGNVTEKTAVHYGYNPRSGKWGRRVGVVVNDSSGDSAAPVLVRATYADIQAFKAVPSARYLMIANGNSTTNVQAVQYPVATATVSGTVPVCSAGTGVFGDTLGSKTLAKIHYRTLSGTDDDSGITVSAAGYSSENRNKTNGSKTLAYNSEFDYADGLLSARFHKITATWASGKKVILAGLGPEYAAQSKR